MRRHHRCVFGQAEREVIERHGFAEVANQTFAQREFQTGLGVVSFSFSSLLRSTAFDNLSRQRVLDALRFAVFNGKKALTRSQRPCAPLVGHDVSPDLDSNVRVEFSNRIAHCRNVSGHTSETSQGVDVSRVRVFFDHRK